MVELGEYGGVAPIGDLEVPLIIDTMMSDGDDINKHDDYVKVDYPDFNMNGFLG